MFVQMIYLCISCFSDCEGIKLRVNTNIEGCVKSAHTVNYEIDILLDLMCSLFSQIYIFKLTDADRLGLSSTVSMHNMRQSFPFNQLVRSMENIVRKYELQSFKIIFSLELI